MWIVGLSYPSSVIPSRSSADPPLARPTRSLPAWLEEADAEIWRPSSKFGQRGVKAAGHDGVDVAVAEARAPRRRPQDAGAARGGAYLFGDELVAQLGAEHQGGLSGAVAALVVLPRPDEQVGLAVPVRVARRGHTDAAFVIGRLSPRRRRSPPGQCRSPRTRCKCLVL